jgi:hypothetical protein
MAKEICVFKDHCHGECPPMSDTLRESIIPPGGCRGCGRPGRPGRPAISGTGPGPAGAGPGSLGAPSSSLSQVSCLPMTKSRCAHRDFDPASAAAASAGAAEEHQCQCQAQRRASVARPPGAAATAAAAASLRGACQRKSAGPITPGPGPETSESSAVTVTVRVTSHGDPGSSGLIMIGVVSGLPGTRNAECVKFWFSPPRDAGAGRRRRSRVSVHRACRWATQAESVRISSFESPSLEGNLRAQRRALFSLSLLYPRLLRVVSTPLTVQLELG